MTTAGREQGIIVEISCKRQSADSTVRTTDDTVRQVVNARLSGCATVVNAKQKIAVTIGL